MKRFHLEELANIESSKSNEINVLSCGTNTGRFCSKVTSVRAVFSFSIRALRGMIRSWFCYLSKNNISIITFRMDAIHAISWSTWYPACWLSKMQSTRTKTVFWIWKPSSFVQPFIPRVMWRDVWGAQDWQWLIILSTAWQVLSTISTPFTEEKTAGSCLRGMLLTLEHWRSRFRRIALSDDGPDVRSTHFEYLATSNCTTTLLFITWCKTKTTWLVSFIFKSLRLHEKMGSTMNEKTYDFFLKY